MSLNDVQVSVVLVDDHTMVRQAVGEVLDSRDGIEVVGQAGSVKEATTLLARLDPPPTVVVVDVSLPDGSGLAVVRAARERSADIGIVVLTMLDDDATLIQALDAGASALVLKSASTDGIVSAVRRAAESPRSFTADGLAEAMRRRAAVPLLTPRETEVLDLLADGAGVAKVAKKLYMSESTVKTHVSKIYGKLGAHNRASAVMAAIRQGLITPRRGS